MNSVFTPVNKNLYQIIQHSTEETDSLIVSSTPSINTSFIEMISSKQNDMKPKRVKVIKKEQLKGKKFWSVEEKIFAIQKAQLMGISKALRLLQNEFPQIYGDLSPSTIQYWVSKCKHLVNN